MPAKKKKTAPAAAAPPDPLLDDLNQEQRQAVAHGSGPLLIVAGAGTGKTMVIARRVAWLVREKMADPSGILAVTFTDKAAGEMEERVDRLLPLGYSDMWISTFHAFCQRVLSEHSLEIGLPDDFRLLNETDAYLLVRRNIDKLKLDHYRPLGNPNKFIRALLKHFSRAKDEAVSPDEYLEFAKRRALDKDDAAHDAEDASRLQELAGAYHAYRKLLLDNDCLDFGDLIMYVLELFRRRPAILEKYRRQFRYVIVDEFQDTNWAQYELLKMLTPPDGNLVVVGDDDQSIYKFRGASVANILQFKNDFPSAREIVLTRNYRSRQGILDLAYKFIRQNDPNRLEAQLAGRAAAGGQALTKRLTAEVPGRAAIECRRFATLEEEAAGTAERIAELRGGGADLSWSDFCVLARSNSTAEAFSTELARRGIPFQFLALKGLYAKPVILDVLAWFALLDDYRESPALCRVLSSPPFRIDGGDLVFLNHEAYRKAESLYEVVRRHQVLDVKPETHAVIDRFLSLLERHTQLARDKGASEMMVRFIYDSGYAGELKHEDAAEARERVSLVGQFLNRLRRFEQGTDEPTVRNFMTEYRLERESGDSGSLAFDVETGPDMVRVMTVHAAKGLEFRHVFVVALADKRFPAADRGGDIELPVELTKETLPEGDIHLEEERRLFYVAVTRAKEGLHLSWAEDYGGKTRKKPSRFLAELGFVNAEEAAGKGKGLPEPSHAPVAAPGAGDKAALPPYFSFTQLAAYASCPLQYKFAHVLRIPVFGKPSFSFGRTMHLTLEKIMAELARRSGTLQPSLFGQQTNASAAGLPVGLDEALRLYEESWQDDWFRSRQEKEEYRKKGREIVEKFHRKISDDHPDTLMVESAFKIRVGGYWLKGKIDRIDRLPGGGVAIIDYKTGRPKTEGKLDRDDKRQLMLYQIAAARALGLRPERLTFLYLDDLSEISFLATEEDLAGFEAELAGQFDRIAAGEFVPTPGWQCAFCDFSGICEFREK